MDVVSAITVDQALKVPLSRATEAISVLADQGVDVSAVRLAISEHAVELIRAPRKLVLLPAPDANLPSVSRIVAELVTFLLPVPEDVGRPIAGELDPLVDVSRIDPTILIDSRYATDDNCAKRALYPPRMRRHCFMRRSAATQLKRAQAALRRDGYGLKIWDGYRPQTVQWRCMDPRVIPDEATRRLFVPPTQGSNHGRGCAVDLTLAHDGAERAMPTGFDSPAPQAASDATDGLTREQLENRQRLHAAMTQAGFAALPHEWWHFNYRPDGRREKSRNAGDLYLVLDLPFETLLAEPC